MQDGTQENVIHIPSPSMSRWQSDFKTNLTSGSGLRSLDIVSMNLTVRTFDRVFQNLLYVLYASDRKAEVFPDPPLLYKNPTTCSRTVQWAGGQRSSAVLLSRDTLCSLQKFVEKKVWLMENFCPLPEFVEKRLWLNFSLMESFQVSAAMLGRPRHIPAASQLTTFCHQVTSQFLHKG